MEYKISDGKKIIAEFLYEQDRDDCLAFLKDKYSDVPLKAENDKE